MNPASTKLSAKSLGDGRIPTKYAFRSAEPNAALLTPGRCAAVFRGLFLLSAVSVVSFIGLAQVRLASAHRDTRRASGISYAVDRRIANDPLSRVFERYTSWHGRSRTLADADVLIWMPCVKLYSGLGDNVRGAMGAYILAMILGRVLYLDVAETPFLQQVAPASFDWRCNSEGPNRCNDLEAFKLDLAYETKRLGVNITAIRRATHGQTAVRLELCELDPIYDFDSWLFSSENRTSLLLALNNLLRYYNLAALTTLPDSADSGSYGWDKGRLFRTLFSVKPSIEKQSKQLSQELRISDGVEYSSLHLRLGRGLREGSKLRFSRWTDLNNLSSCIAASVIVAYENIQSATKPVSRGRSKPPVFYLATDTHEVFDALKTELEELWQGTRLVMAPFTPVHSGHFPSLEGATNSWVDLYTLSRGEHLLVGIPSGFANLAGWLSGRPKYFLGPCTDGPLSSFARREAREIPLMINT